MLSQGEPYFHLFKLRPYDREQKQVSENYVVFLVGGILWLKIIIVSSVHKLSHFICRFGICHQNTYSLKIYKTMHYKCSACHVSEAK